MLIVGDEMNFAFLDSGIGGIPYMKKLKALSPDSTCAYLADTAHFPYGEKSFDEIIDAATQAASLALDKWRPETLVVACNTISVAALRALRARFPDVPIVGTVPAIKLAAELTINKKIGLLATRATISDGYVRHLVADFAQGCEIFPRGDAALVSFIEKKLPFATDEEKAAAAWPALSYFEKCGCDVIVLGCTHFTWLSDFMQSRAGNNVRVVDSREGVARQALRVHDEFLEKRSARPPDIFGAAADFLASTRDEAFFVTGVKDEAAEKRYKAMCRSFGLAWGGVLA